jgi:hypothetical protein
MHRTLLVAFVIPGLDGSEDGDDAEAMADVLCGIINEERERNWPENPQPIGVSAIPAAQWVTTESLGRLRESANLQPIKGYCGFEDADGNVAVVGADQALDLAQRHEPFAVYRSVTLGDR